MQAPISVGHILQNRYKILRILGQGGFGRTYLAEDTRRFNELCAIKELIPVTTETGAWDKARELFQREAAILYQIQHPQVPQFRERFEEDQRLFLVQDYVPGQTYRTLLEERKLQGKTFTEMEVIQIMRLLLPILEHIHGLGIIHRDISPENIILRERDNLPVLIDFGVVKELATKLQAPTQSVNATAVGKLGYAPSEQMQTGRAYASSDLYSLAVTAIVLLTGKEPQELYDETQVAWNWQRYASVNPRFAQILNRMLSYIPSDRYQTAAEVIQALAGLSQATPAFPVSPPSPTVPANISNLQTLAVGARPDPTPSSTPDPSSPQRPHPVIPNPSDKSILDNPLAVGAIGAAVVILAGFGSWAIVSSIRNNARFPQENIPTSPQTFPSPVISEPQTPTPTPTVLEPITSSKRLRFDSSGIAREQGTIRANETIEFTFQGTEGERLTATLDQVGTVAFTVLTPRGEPIDSIARQVSSYQGILPLTGRYTIQMYLLPGLTEGTYNFSLSLQKPMQDTPTPVEPEPTEAPIDQNPVIPPTDVPPSRPDVKPKLTPKPTPDTPPDFNNGTVVPTEPNNNQAPIEEGTPTPNQYFPRF
ncbi:serine/threonine-protein kinase [Calothrix sp. NIES-3974]|uniref:serine/threonine-protein kinase n=1 Tax=Calothrix sp. NIES-3974 TaxID=2005462 RepID=UPI000B5E481A|nr:serine/threonine-protein kinase [Calothrix sp. NIES-3974]BAZ03518.1 serine/threonine protein kinase [Calothrix sp. NIES-3974]